VVEPVRSLRIDVATDAETQSTLRKSSGPLALEFAVPQDSANAELHFEVKARDQSATMELIERVISAFRDAVSIGMFGDCAVLETNAQEPSGVGSVRQRWRVAGLQPGAYRVLLDMLEAVHSHALPLASLRLSVASPMRPALDWRTVQALPYPPVSQKADFVVRLREDIDEAKEPVIRLAFASDVADEIFETLSSMFLVWDDLVLLGGFRSDFGALECDSGAIDRQTYMVSRDTVEHILYWVVGDGAAFDALVNVATRVHATACPLLAIEVD
jgi:hypothetical protein